MLYSIDLFRDGKRFSSEQWDRASLEDVRKHIETAVRIGVADWAEVRDSTGEVVIRNQGADIMPKPFPEGAR